MQQTSLKERDKYRVRAEKGKCLSTLAYSYNNRATPLEFWLMEDASPYINWYLMENLCKSGTLHAMAKRPEESKKWSRAPDLELMFLTFLSQKIPSKSGFLCIFNEPTMVLGVLGNFLGFCIEISVLYFYLINMPLEL